MAEEIPAEVKKLVDETEAKIKDGSFEFHAIQKTEQESKEQITWKE